MAKLSMKKQDELIADEINKWDDILKSIPSAKKEAAVRLIERVAFMTITLQVLEDDVKTKGPTYKFKNGSQEMFVENPSQKSYNTMINRYTAACEKLFNLIPEPKDDSEKKTTASDLL